MTKYEKMNVEEYKNINLNPWCITIKVLNEQIEKFLDKYPSVDRESIWFEIEDGYDTIRGTRLETNEEFEKRVKRIEEYERKQKDQKLKAKERSDKKAYEQYLQLKKKFEKG